MSGGVSNPALTSLTGLGNLTTIVGKLKICNNDALTSLTGLDNITSVGGHLYIINNDALTSLTGLDNVTSIGGDLAIANNIALISLMGLDNIDGSSINGLYINGNMSLSTCHVQSVCDYLAAPGGTIEIYNNSPGCDSQQEVEEACGITIINEWFAEDYLALYPNPAKHEVNVSTDDGREVEDVSIYTLTGQQVLQVRPVNGTVDISVLQPGMYIVEVTIDNTRIKQKLLVQR
jgi:hypothetical protein